MRAPLLRWFDAHARRLPWRGLVRDPYATLVAETMLQQTQASRVAQAYPRFLRAFPDVTALAAAEEDRVLAAWQGLGYYRRARSLHAAARELAARGGVLPGDPGTLARLPGIGRYTAVAVAAQAFGRPGIAVDANVRRVGRRVLGTAGATDAAIEHGLGEMLLAPRGAGARRRGEVAEALIELGALVCTARAPSCRRCPLARGCAARGDEPLRFDPPPRPDARRLERWSVLVALDGGDAALVRRPAGGRWGGLWGFPIADGSPTADALPPVAHTISGRRLLVTPVIGSRSEAPAGSRWVPLGTVAAGAATVPVAGIDRKIAAAAGAAAGAASTRRVEPGRA